MLDLSTSDNVALIVIASLIAILPKFIPALFITFIKINAFFKRFLKLIPYTAMTSMCFPSVFSSIGTHYYIATTGALFAIALAYKGLNLSLTVIFTVVLVVALVSFV